MDHYAGPARITKQVGKRSFLIEYRNAKGIVKVFQRDAGMLSLLHPATVNFEPEDTVVQIHVPHKHRSLTTTPLREGEIRFATFVFFKARSGYWLKNNFN
jgi:hypothetical protein